MKVNQEALILNHIMKHGSITARVAREKYKVKSLSSRICQLRRMGVAIQTTKFGYSLPYWVKVATKKQEQVETITLFDYDKN